MSNEWLLMDTGPQAAAWNMACDEALLQAVARLGRPVLRFYGWTEPAATFGYSQKYAEIAGWTSLRPLIRRPTGGGLVPHDADWTYSLVCPPEDVWYALSAEQSYQRVHDWIAGSFQALAVEASLASGCKKELPGQCFAGAEKYDVVAHGRKIAGAAQRRTRGGLLIQGSIQPPAGISRPAWQTAFCAWGMRSAGVAWAPFTPDRSLEPAIETLVRDKYSQPAHNERR